MNRREQNILRKQTEDDEVLQVDENDSGAKTRGWSISVIVTHSSSTVLEVIRVVTAFLQNITSFIVHFCNCLSISIGAGFVCVGLQYDFIVICPRKKEEP